jgi:hypothetical protein
MSQPDEKVDSGAADPSKASEVEDKDVKKLTPEEQMALYEKSLKEDDWGHQPC